MTDDTLTPPRYSNSYLSENNKINFQSAGPYPERFPSLQPPDSENNFLEFISFLKRRFLPIVALSSLVLSGFVYSLLSKENVYEGSFRILVEPVSSDRTPLPFEVSGGGGLDYPSQIEILQSKAIINEVVPELQSSYPEITYESLLGGLNIRRLGETKILQVQYRSKNPEMIDSVLRTLSKFYLEYSLEKRKTKLNQGVAFVDEQLPGIKNRVSKLQLELQIFRQKYWFVNPGDQSTNMVGQIQSIEAQKTALEQKLTTARASYSSLLTARGQRALLNSAPLYTGLVGQLRQLETQLAGESVRFQPDNPYLKTLREKRESLLPIIEDEQRRYIGLKMDEIASTIESMEIEKQEIIKAEQQIKARFQIMPVLARQYEELQRNLELANESFNRFLEAREKLLVEVAQTEIPWELIQPPTTSRVPVLPDTFGDLRTALFAALAAGIGFGFLLEKLDDTYHEPVTLEEKTKLPLLGVVPKIKSITSSITSPLPQQKETESSTSPGKTSITFLGLKKSRKRGGYYGYYGESRLWQSLEILYANIQLLNSDKVIKSLTISSSIKSEGKSTISSHLAIVAASLGKKVAIVDADLRLPKLHTLFDLPNIIGLSNLITSNLAVQEVIQYIPNLPTLSVITSGPQPPDPIRLISSEKMKQLMTHLSENFDLVIYDTPPLYSLVDAKLIVPQTDGMLLIVKMNSTDKSTIAQVQNSLKQSSTNVLGIVANYSKKDPHNYYDYYYLKG